MLKTVLVPLDYAALLPDAAAGAGAVCKVEFYASNIESGAERAEVCRETTRPELSSSHSLSPRKISSN